MLYIVFPLFPHSIIYLLSSYSRIPPLLHTYYSFTHSRYPSLRHLLVSPSQTLCIARSAFLGHPALRREIGVGLSQFIGVFLFITRNLFFVHLIIVTVRLQVFFVITPCFYHPFLVSEVASGNPGLPILRPVCVHIAHLLCAFSNK